MADFLPNPTPSAERYLENLAAKLDVPASRYEEAERRYKAVGEWLGRDDSSLNEYSPDVYVQGSFGLGTAIRPANDEEHYDIDLVCELSADKAAMSQKDLKDAFGKELGLYASAHGMNEIEEGRRCWTLQYADGAQFHLDALPAVPDGKSKRKLLELQKFDTTWSDTAIAITDREQDNYRQIGHQWPHSNPKGYAKWFRSRMERSFQKLREAMALDERANIEDVPFFRVKTPLQKAIQILKRHRDVMFADDPDNKPISVIITTLAAHAYNNESSVALALTAILEGVRSHIDYDAQGHEVISNPTDRSENFAERWVDYPIRRDNFFNWLNKAAKDFAEIASLAARTLLVETAGPVVGERLAKDAAIATPESGRSWLPALFSVAHKKPAPWPVVRTGTVSIETATWTAKGFSRPKQFYSNSEPLRKNANLVFRSKTDIPAPFDVYWQVVNTGAEALAAKGLRGGFDTGLVDRGTILHKESTLYTGSHTIECLIVKNGYLVARSGAFIVSIR